MFQYILVGFVGAISLLSICGFLFLKEGTKGLKAKAYKTKSGIVHTAEKSKRKTHSLNVLNYKHQKTYCQSNNACVGQQHATNS